MTAYADALRALYDMKANVPMRDHADTRYRVSPDVWDELVDASGRPGDLDKPPPAETERERYERMSRPPQLFGIPVDVDENLPPRTCMVEVANAFDRALRRAYERHEPVMVYNQPIPWTPPPLPPVTLKALLRKWWKRARKVVRR
jgi:hypothetical protein